MTLALGLDLGTTSISAIAVRDDGTVERTVQVANKAAISGLPAGVAEQDPHHLRTTAFSALQELTRSLSEKPHCLGLTGQMHGVLLLDNSRTPLTNLVTWQDRRANNRLAPDGPTILEQLLQTTNEEDISRAGCRLSPGYLAVTLYALARSKNIPKETKHASFLADWIAAELCGVDLSTDRSNAASSGVYDLSQDCWSTPLASACQIEESWFPQVRESGEVIGHMTTEASRQTGLPVGLPVCNAIGDNQAAVLGSVPANSPAIQINIGTGGQISWPVDKFVRLPGMDTRYLPHSRFMLVGAGLAGGDAYAWVHRMAVRLAKDLGLEVDSQTVYERMNQLASGISSAPEGLLCEPLFRGTRQNPQARGTFSGITPDNFSLGHISRAVLQGIADGLYSFYENAEEAKPTHFRRIVASGNGLRKNPLLTSIIADTFQRPVFFPVHTEEAAYGAALLAGASTGMWNNLKSAGSCIQLATTKTL